jgi:hypothetical protein
VFFLYLCNSFFLFCPFEVRVFFCFFFVGFFLLFVLFFILFSFSFFLSLSSFLPSTMRALRHGAHHAPASVTRRQQQRASIARPGTSSSSSTTSSSRSPFVAALATSASAEAPPSAVGISPPAVGSHFLHVDDWSREKLDAVLATAQEVKAIFKSKDAQDFKPLAGKTMAMIFTKPSMRTRVSFETVRSFL